MEKSNTLDIYKYSRPDLSEKKCDELQLSANLLKRLFLPSLGSEVSTSLQLMEYLETFYHQKIYPYTKFF